MKSAAEQKHFQGIQSRTLYLQTFEDLITQILNSFIWQTEFLHQLPQICSHERHHDITGKTRKVKKKRNREFKYFYPNCAQVSTLLLHLQIMEPVQRKIWSEHIQQTNDLRWTEIKKKTSNMSCIKNWTDLRVVLRRTFSCFMCLMSLSSLKARLANVSDWKGL